METRCLVEGTIVFSCFCGFVAQSTTACGGSRNFCKKIIDKSSYYMNTDNKGSFVRHVSEIDWEHWIPKERAVLCFIQNGDQLMLIHKKTGLGKGKVNAPGGRIEPGESQEEAAIRETTEEIGLVPANLHKRGELFFIFTDGYSLHATVFFSTKYTGTLIETIEAAPFWCSIKDIPYKSMWEDDSHWLPLALAGNTFKAYFIFDNDTMLSFSIDLTDK